MGEGEVLIIYVDVDVVDAEGSFGDIDDGGDDVEGISEYGGMVAES